MLGPIFASLLCELRELLYFEWASLVDVDMEDDDAGEGSSEHGEGGWSMVGNFLLVLLRCRVALSMT
jgi:hypothetical protein